MDRIVAFVKADCETCQLVAPLLAELIAEEVLDEIVCQDADFPGLAPGSFTYDEALERSWHADIETVPTVISHDGNTETARVVGWSRSQWSEFFGVAGLGSALPEQRPGCGAKNVEPELVDILAAKFGDAQTTSRRIEFAIAEDPIEAMYDRGWSDGLPLVPPTPERVAAMLRGTSREASDIVATVAPNLVDASVEKVAINAVMAGCRPEYLPVVIASLEAVCNDDFNMHGVLATTMGVGPVLVVNGPIRHELQMNSGINALGQGNRANATIGRAVQLCVRNIGGGRPGEIDRATHGQPGKLGLCFAEDEEGSPWNTLAEQRGFSHGANTVTAFTGEAPRIIFDQMSRTADALTASIAQAMLANVHPRITGMDTMLVLCPEHMARFRDAGWDKARFESELREHLDIEVDSILRGVDGIGEGIPPGLGFEGATLPKFREDGILIVHAGGSAGLFSSVLGGWVSGAMGSVPVTKEIEK